MYKIQFNELVIQDFAYLLLVSRLGDGNTKVSGDGFQFIFGDGGTNLTLGMLIVGFGGRDIDLEIFHFIARFFLDKLLVIKDGYDAGVPNPGFDNQVVNLLLVGLFRDPIQDPLFQISGSDKSIMQFWDVDFYGGDFRNGFLNRFEGGVHVIQEVEIAGDLIGRTGGFPG